MPILFGRDMLIRPSKSGSRPEINRNNVVLPQPDGPKSAQISACRRPKATFRSMTRFCPEAARKIFWLIETSTFMQRPPAGDMPLERLHDDRFDREHKTDKGKRIGKEARHVEELEGNADFEANAVRAAEQFGNQDN